MILSILCVIGLLVIGFIEYYMCMNFAAKISMEKKSYSLSNRKIKDAHKAFTKGNYLSKYVLKDDNRKMINIIRARRILTVVFIMSFFL